MPTSAPQAFKWRTPTKIIAIVDLVVSILTIVYLVLVLIGIFFLTDSAVDKFHKESGHDRQSKDDADTAKGIFMVVSAVVFGIAILFVVVMIVAAKSLLDSSKEGIIPTEALSKAKCWRILNIIFVIFCVLGIFGGGDPAQKGFSLIDGILRGVAVVIVTLYMKELDIAATGPQVYYESGAPS